MRLVASPVLEAADVEALTAGNEQKEEILQRVAARNLGDIENLIVRDRLGALAWLIANGSLEVRLAIRTTDEGLPATGIYHEKMGIFSDTQGNHVAFSGSANETSGGLVSNFESVDVYWSWDDPHARVERKIRDFEDLWENQTRGVSVIEFTQVSRELLKRYELPASTFVNEEAASPKTLEIKKPARDYQNEAIDAWFAANCRGILAMATGSGKTLTALHAVNRLADRGPLVMIIACPYVNLAEQWVRELQAAGIPRPIKAYGGKSQWKESLESAMIAIQFGKRKFLPIVVVNRTFLSPTFQAMLCPERITHLLVADEMHNLGAENLRNQLDSAFQYRLGLSATPERHMDGEGTKALFDYFGDVIFTYNLARAIKEKNLCPYFYHPVLVELSDNEATEYERLSVQIGRMMARQSPDDALSTALQGLLLRRARLLASAEGKIPALLSVISDLREQDQEIARALIYCGDGQVDAPDDDGLVRQMDAAIQLLGRDARLKVARFSHKESTAEREQHLTALKTSRLDVLVAIRCLDEGIDLPDVRMGFILASSTNPRQFIQRRGRLLRKSEGKDRAEIWDFIVSPPDLTDLVEGSVFNIERKMVARELARVQEFCSTALNADSAKAVLLDLQRRYNLLADV